MFLLNTQKKFEDDAGHPFQEIEDACERPPRILLIEDDRFMRRLVYAKLRNLCEIHTAQTMGQGAHLYLEKNPDLILIDVGLPDGNGFSLLSWILGIDPEAFAVMFTGHDDNDTVWRSMTYGAKGFISKPFDEQKMLFFIKRCMEK